MVMVKTISIFVILLCATASFALELKCYSECRFFKPSCEKKEVNRALSTDEKNPSMIYTDSIIYCDVDGASSKDGEFNYSLLITGQKTKLEVVKEKVIHLKKDESIKPKLKYNNFTFSNPYLNQKVQVRFGNKSKTFFFSGLNIQ